MKSNKFILIVVLAVLVSVGVSVWWNIATLPKKSKAWGPVLPTIQRCDCDCITPNPDNKKLCYKPYQFGGILNPGQVCNDWKFSFDITDQAGCQDKIGDEYFGFREPTYLGNYLSPTAVKCRLRNCTVNQVLPIPPNSL